MSMAFRLYQKLKQCSVTLRVSILTIFITLFVVSMLALITLIHVQFRKTAVYVSLQLMQAACCSTAFNEIVSQLDDTEMKSKSAGALIQMSVVDSKNTEMLNYLTNLMRNETRIYPALRSVYWADNAGNFIEVRKDDDGTLMTAIVDHSVTPSKVSISYHDTDGHLVNVAEKTAVSIPVDFDPRTRPWYLAAVREKKTTWLPVYRYQVSGFLGTSAATPVFTADGKLLGVISFNMRLDDLRGVIEKIPISKTGVLFIVTKDNKLVAFPHLDQFNHPALDDVAMLNHSFPWVVQAWQEFKKSGQDKFIYHYHGERYLAAFRPLPPFGVHQWIIGAVSPEKDFTSTLHKMYITSMLIAFVILIVCIFIVSGLVSRVIQSLGKITQEIKRIKQDRKSTRLNSSHSQISYAVFCLKKKKNKNKRNEWWRVRERTTDSP